jgi:primosomal protein N' (replication factor Y) (superfamily II helicase)
LIADVAFDTPVPHAFSYTVPEGMAVCAGQRVAAPLGRGTRTGVVVAVREADASGLKSLSRVAEAAPVLDASALDLARWIAEQSLSSLGSTLAALLPPAIAFDQIAAPSRTPLLAAGEASSPELLIGAGRERRLVERVATSATPALVIVPDVEAAGRWTQRLERHGPVARLDSGVDDDVRAAGWRRLAAGDARVAVGTRSALLAPLQAGAMLALVDEHDPAHKPPGAPRLHSRDVVLERAARSSLEAVLTSATPSVEMWWRAESGRARAVPGDPAPWPLLQLADTRGILKVEPLTPTLARAVRETLGAGRRVLLVVSRLTSALACDECGTIQRCPDCAVAFSYTRAARALTCRVCGRRDALPETCPACHGRRLSPFGWGTERVEHAVRRRFPNARVARYEPDRTRGARAAAQRQAAAEAEVVIGTRAALRLFGPAALGLVGFVTPDQQLRLPDFRASERLFAALWAAAERVAPGGGLVAQSQTPEHYVFEACARQELGIFYRRELSFRGELGYPPFRRLAIVTVSAPDAAVMRRLADDVAAALTGLDGVTAYPPAPDRRDRARRIVVKGHANLAAILAESLAEFRGPRPKSRGIIDIEVDPVEWPS